MEPDRSTLEALEEIARLTTGAVDYRGVAAEIVKVAMRTVGCEYGGLTLHGAKHRLETVGASDPLVVQADRWQYELREGPCVAAAAVGETYVVNDLAHDERWPRWGPKVAELGLGSLLATRMANGEQVIGALNLYGVRERQFSPDDLDFAMVFAIHATAALVASRQLETLRLAVDARTLIGQAQGVLMERLGLDAEQAFAVLRRFSQDRNVKLREVAEQVIARPRAVPSD